MTKTASLAVFLWLSASAWGCGEEAQSTEAQSTEAQSTSDPTATPADVGAPPADAMVTASGLASKQLEPGTGTRHPLETDRVRVDYAGWTPDGRLFDASYNRGTPSEFPLTGVIQGWTEGLQLMVEGERRRFWIPEALAYPDPQRGQPAGPLVFDVELLAILDP